MAAKSAVVLSVVKYADESEGRIVWEQWSRAYGHRRNDAPEDALLIAILEDAIRELIVLQDRTHHKLALETRLRHVRRWFGDRRSEDILSFNFIWERFFPQWSMEKARVYLLDYPERVAEKIQRYKIARKRSGSRTRIKKERT